MSEFKPRWMHETRASNIILTIIVATWIIFIFGFTTYITYEMITEATNNSFRICEATIYTDNMSIPIRLYYAWNPALMSQGYKNKDSYDFLDKGAVGMLFIVNYSSIEITMRDVKFPLVAVLYIANDSIVERGSFPKLISIDSIYLEPSKDYVITKQIYAFIEYDPIFYYRYLNKTHVVEIKSCG